MPEINAQTRLRELLLAMESGQLQGEQDLELLNLLAKYPELRSEYLEFVQFMSLQHEVHHRFDRKDRLRKLESLMQIQMERPLDEKEQIQLQDCLSSSKRVRSYYFESCQLDAMLKENMGGLAQNEYASHNKRDQASEVAKVIKFNPWQIALLAASILLVLETAFLLTYFVPNLSDGVEQSKPITASEDRQGINKIDTSLKLASILDSRGAKLRYQSEIFSNLKSKSHLHGGEFELTDGLLKLEFHGGASVVMEAPAKFELINTKTMKLINGRVSADVPEAAIGFTIDTPTSEVVDLGTSFAVEVDHTGRDEVHVFDGEVVIKSKQAELMGPLHLYQNQALRLDVQTHTPANIDVDKTRFLRQIKEGSNPFSKTMLAMEPMLYLNMSPSFDGLSLYDLTGNGYDAQAVNYEQQQPNWAPGVFGMAAEFGGPGTKWGYIIPNFPKIESGSFTVMAWIYAESRPQWASIAKNWFMEKGQFHFGLRELTGKLEGHIYDEANEEEIFVTDTEVLPLNRWHHVVMSAGEGKMSLYRNGVLVDQQEIPGLFHNPKFDWISIGAKIGIGRETTSEEDDKFVITDLKHIKGSFWDGMIDELSLFNRVLKSEEITKLYQLGRAHLDKSGLN